MSTLSQSIPNLLQGISQQPDNRKRPGQLNESVNAFPDFALGLLKRPGGQFVAKLHQAPTDGKWFPILRDTVEKYIACYSDNRFHVWDLIQRTDDNGVATSLAGSVRVVNMGNHSGQPVASDKAAELTDANTLNDEVVDTAEELEDVQEAEVTLARAIIGRTKVRTKKIAFNTKYDGGQLREFLTTGILEDSDGTFIVKEDDVVYATSSSLPTHIVKLTNDGSGFSNGTHDNVATSGGSGSGLTVDLFVEDGEISTAIINAVGDGDYVTGETLSITGFNGAELTVHKLTQGTERTADHPVLASTGFRCYEAIFEAAETHTAQQLTDAEDAYNNTTPDPDEGALPDFNAAETAEDTARTNYNTDFNAGAITALPANTLRIVENGEGLTNGAHTAEATATTGNGSNMTVDLRVTDGHVVIANINAAGSGYALDDEITLTGSNFTNAVRITEAGESLTNGSSTGVATTAITGSGSGMTVNITVSGGEVTAATINAAGSGYKNGDTVSINGFADTVLTISIVTLEFARSAYLEGADAEDIEVLTLNDYTFIVNKNKTVRMREKTAHATGFDEHRAQVVINIAANSTNYEVLLTQGSSTTTFSHTAGSSGASSDSIAAALTTSIDGNSAYDATQVGASIYITSNSAFTVETRGGATENAIFALTDTIGDTTRLPLQSKNGYVVRVVNSEDIEIDDMYVEFTTDGDGTFGTGQWSETVAPGLKFEFDELTMPHQLVRESDNTFTYGPVDWNNRLVGDDETNPEPSFVGGRISHMFFYRNRMGFLSGQSVVLSKAGDLFNFWNTSAQAPTQDDPIDISAAGKRPVFLHYASTTSVGLVMYSSNEQFLLTTDSDVLSPTSAKVNSISTYECDPDLEAVSVGTSQAFISKTPLFTRTFELLDVTADQPPQLAELTNVVPELIPNSINSMTASPVLSLLSMGTTGSSTLYQYRFLMRTKTERAISTWYKWDLTGTLLLQFFDSSTFYCVVRNGDDVYVQSYDLTQSSEEGFLTLPTGERTDVCLDLFHINPHRTYDEDDDETRIFLPYEPVTGKEFNVVVLGGYIGDTSTNTTESVGAVLKPTIAGSAGARHVDISGDYRGRDLIIGFRYDMTVDLPKFYRYSVNEGQVTNDDVSSLIIHRIKVKTGLCGPLDYKISITGLNDWDNTVSVTQPNTYQLNNVNMQASATHVVPIYQRNENLAVRIIGNTPFPVSLLGVDWEGKLNQRFYRRG